MLNGQPARRFGSQGQQKSFILAMRLAQFALMKYVHTTAPILMLDDLFDKLDEQRIKAIVDILDSSEFEQVFITEARPERTRLFLNKPSGNYRFIEVQQGRVLN